MGKHVQEFGKLQIKPHEGANARYAAITAARILRVGPAPKAYRQIQHLELMEYPPVQYNLNA